jgi:hypothetical protein
MYLPLCISWCQSVYNKMRGLYNFKFVQNNLKTKRTCFIHGLSAYRAVNTLHFGYKNQSLNVL